MGSGSSNNWYCVRFRHTNSLNFGCWSQTLWICCFSAAGRTQLLPKYWLAFCWTIRTSFLSVFKPCSNYKSASVSFPKLPWLDEHLMTAGVTEVLRIKNFLFYRVPPHLVLPLLCFILPYRCKIFRLRFANSLVLSSFKPFLKSSVLVSACWHSPLNSDCHNFFSKCIFTPSRIKNCALYLLRLISFAYILARQKRIFNSLCLEKKSLS